MVWIFTGLLFGYLLLFFLTRTYKRQQLRHLNTKEHRLRWLYPMAARVVDLRARLLPSMGQDTISLYMRSLLVKENVEWETWVFRVRKMAVCILISGVFLFLGLLTGWSEKGIRQVQSLSRAEYGEGSTHYELEVNYRNQEEDFDLDLEQRQLTESEIRERMEWAYEDVREIVLGENPSQDEISKPLHLISEYKGITISWEIDDISALNYSGEIRAQLEEHETKTLNLYATFTMDQISEVYVFPICLVAPDLSAREQLLQSIREAIAENNSAFAKEVNLPEKINGYTVAFWKRQENKAYLFLVMAILAAILILLFYDRTLKEQIRKRQEQMMIDFTEIVSKLSLLYEAGLSIHGAFTRIVDDYKKKTASGRTESRFAYQELQLVLEKIASGVRENEAYAQFGRRCGLYPYIKLGNLLEQNLSKGTKGMKLLLKQEVNASFEERKRAARKKGEEAGTKLLFPMILMMLVVIAIVAVPALMSVHT